MKFNGFLSTFFAACAAAETVASLDLFHDELTRVILYMGTLFFIYSALASLEYWVADWDWGWEEEDSDV